MWTVPLKSVAVGSLCLILAQAGPSSCSAPPGNGGAPRGACCVGDGTCQVTTEAGCSGGYVGDDSTCEAADCPEPTGACCLDDGSCSIVVGTACDGAFQDAGTACSASACAISPFTEEAAARGVDYLVIFGRGDEAGSGVALIDLDNDNDADLVTLGKVGEGVVGVFENDGTGHFTDRSADTGITPLPDARGVSAADYDDDGDLDLYLSQWLVANVLLRNDGGFRFTDVTATAGVGGIGHGAGSAWADYDGDGRVDLYVANWEDTDRNFLYRNLGNGTFEEIGRQEGIASEERSYQPVWLDYDGDSDLDLYLSNDNRVSNCGGDRHNELFRNDDGHFTDVSVESGADVCFNSMGAAVGDFDRNLFPDLHFTNLTSGNVLIMNQGDGTFLNGSAAAGIDQQGEIGWGTVAFDYDHNGSEDLYVVFNNGVNRLYTNPGVFPLENIADQLGLDFLAESYCVATGDIDLDGDLDLVLSSRQEPIRIYINNEGQKRDGVKFKVVGEGTDRGGIGARVEVLAGGARQVRHLLFGNNYKSQNEPVLHFGLGGATVLDEVAVSWPTGSGRALSGYSANTTWTLYPPERLGDVNGDGVIDSTDTAAMTNCQGSVRPGCEMMDYDGDADVDSTDAARQAQ